VAICSSVSRTVSGLDVARHERHLIVRRRFDPSSSPGVSRDDLGVRRGPAGRRACCLGPEQQIGDLIRVSTEGHRAVGDKHRVSGPVLIEHGNDRSPRLGVQSTVEVAGLMCPRTSVPRGATTTTSREIEHEPLVTARANDACARSGSFVDEFPS